MLLSASCGSTTLINARLINCPGLISEELRAGPEVTQAEEPDGTAGGWVNFGQETEAGRLSENRDKRTVVHITDTCHAENVRINTPPRRRILGIF